MAKSFLNNANYNRGLRNNNPGNLIYTTIPWDGKIPYAQNKDYDGQPTNIKRKFEQFVDLKHGIRALMRDIVNDINKGQNTVHSFISAYAPKTENNTAAYISSVAQSLLLSPFAVIELTEDNVITLAKAIVKMEIGANDARLVTEQDYSDALAILDLDVPLKKKAQATA